MARHPLLPVPAVLLLAAAAAPAAAETLGCSVLSAPPVAITAPGRYCLAQSYAQDFGDSVGIDIATSDAVLDCNGHGLRHTDPAGTGAIGIQVGYAVTNVTVRGCTVEGFHHGITVDQPIGHADANVRLLDNQVLRFRLYGIFAHGSGLVIEGNRISDPIGDSTASGPIGIYLVRGGGNVLRGNSITDFRQSTPPDTGVNTMGMYLNDQINAVVEDNVIAGLRAMTNYGVWAILADGTSSGLALARNVIVAPPQAAPPLSGGNYYAVWLQGTQEQTDSNVCRDNIAGHFNTNISGCQQDLTTGF